MSLANTVLGVIWFGVIAYAIFGGADFGAGIWDLVAGGPEKGKHPRALLERSIGPVWEANHVWLIFVLVFLWTGFPDAFVSIMTTLYIPMMLAGIGIVLRGSAFAFRKWAPTLGGRQALGAAFAGASVVTPFFLGTVAGGVASGRVPPGNAAGDAWTSWINPTSILGGVLAVVVCAYVAAVLVSRDADRSELGDLAEYFRVRALVAGMAAGVLALVGAFVIRSDAPTLYDGLSRSYGLVIVAISGIAGVASLAAIYFRKRRMARVGAVAATVTILWGWAVGQYPWLLPEYLTIEQGAAADVVLVALLVAFVAAAAIAVPALIWLLTLTDRGTLDATSPTLAGSSEALLSALDERARARISDD
ncbi:MAG: cytochrome d ubiquinol oxidase subunit II [Actinomycetia bacterium]|nr:cytochrome d ubiquinol oxidase subunit II [Actinomycetes bacterium]